MSYVGRIFIISLNIGGKYLNELDANACQKEAVYPQGVNVSL